MKLHYEAPAAEAIDFRAQEKLAVIEEDMGPEADAGVGSKDF